MSLQLKHIGIFVLMAASIWSCSLVDEDLRDCKPDYLEADYHLDYELRLVTNMTTELQTQLSLAADINVKNALAAYLSNVFTDKAHDVNLGFYDVVEDSTLLHHESHIMDANQSSYTLYIPVRRYMHLALANLENNDLVSLEGPDRCHTSRIVQKIRDTIPSHTSGIFSARLPMDIQEGKDQQFDVRLYMSNCASAVVIDTLGSNVKDVKVYMSGFATSFDVCDSLYQYSYTPIIRADKLPLSAGEPICYTAVTFPSRPVEKTKVIIQTDDPDISESAESPLWQIRCYCVLKDGTVTETILGLTKPLSPGNLKVVTAKAQDNGTITTGDPSVVAVSITLDWSSGLDHQVIL